MIIQGMQISVVPTGNTEPGDALGEMVEVQIIVTGNGSALPVPGTFWRPKSEMQ